jgi:hypothetical protein
MMHRAAVGLAVLSHLLAWGALLWLVFYPNYYQGVGETIVAPGTAPRVETSVSASLIAVNGWSVLRVLIVPPVLSGVGLVSVWLSEPTRGAKALQWFSALLLFGFCVLGAFSIGVFYVPAAVALLTAVVLEAGRRVATESR